MKAKLLAVNTEKKFSIASEVKAQKTEATPVEKQKSSAVMSPVDNDAGFMCYAKSKLYHVVVTVDGVKKTLCGDILSGNVAVDKVKDFFAVAPDGKRLCKNCEKRQ